MYKQMACQKRLDGGEDGGVEEALPMAAVPYPARDVRWLSDKAKRLSALKGAD